MNNRILILFVLLAGVHVLALAQPRLRAPEMYIGVHGGVAASTVLFNPEVPNMSPIYEACTLSPGGGLVFRYAGHKCCGVQVELNYNQRGWREANENGAYFRRLHYVDVPFLMHLFFGKKHGKFIFNLGPEIGYCVLDDHGTGNRQTSDIHQYDPISRPFYWGVAGGLGGYYRSDKAGVWQIEARFNYSMGSVFDNSVSSYFRNQSNPMELSVHLGWLWPLK